MKELSLNGTWTLRKEGNLEENIQALVPGCVHMDLLREGLISDPYDRDNEIKLLWIADQGWTYERQFFVDESMMKYEEVSLCCEGLDTLAHVYINGNKIGYTDNMFRTWEFSVKNALHVGQNSIRIVFDAIMPYVREKEKIRHLHAPIRIRHEEYGRPWVRKEQCNFGWDWGPVLPTSGIWRSIKLVGANTARIDDILVEQRHLQNCVDLEISVLLNRIATTGVIAEVILTDPELNNVTVTSEPATEENISVCTSVQNPHLWWPNGMGAQSLYNLTINIYNTNKELLDTTARKIGLRRIELVQEDDAWGRSFYFRSNGISFFAKGANWIPADAFAPSVKDSTYRQLLQSMVDANMNMIRIWGGGIYEQDEFYNFCDEFGILVWQDFMFACSAYPADDPQFVENLKEEFKEQVKRLQHRACLALWCGNNEMEMIVAKDKPDNTWPKMPWDVYTKLFDDILPSIVHMYDSSRSYWPSSPHTPVGDRIDHWDPSSGDAHLWAVWHGREPFEWYRTAFHRFCSEFGFQSFPEPRTIASFARENERNITSPIMEFHQRGQHGNPNIMHYMLSWFRMPRGNDATYWMSQIQQGLSIKYAVEHWRQNMPRCMGALFWQLNDCWPVASWASIDYFGRWKALQYMAKRFFAPILVSGVENIENGTVDVFISCDHIRVGKGCINWRITDAAGTIYDRGEAETTLQPHGSSNVTQIDVRKSVDSIPLEQVMVWLEMSCDSRVVSENLVLFGRPKHLSIPKPGYTITVNQDNSTSFAIVVKCTTPLYWLFFHSTDKDILFSDNFFSMPADSEKTIYAYCRDGMSLSIFKQMLKATTLFDLYEE